MTNIIYTQTFLFNSEHKEELFSKDESHWDFRKRCLISAIENP